MQTFSVLQKLKKTESVSNYLLFYRHNIIAGYHWFYEILHVDELDFGIGGDTYTVYIMLKLHLGFDSFLHSL